MQRPWEGIAPTVRIRQSRASALVSGVVRVLIPDRSTSGAHADLCFTQPAGPVSCPAARACGQRRGPTAAEREASGARSRGVGNLRGPWVKAGSRVARGLYFVDLCLALFLGHRGCGSGLSTRLGRDGCPESPGLGLRGLGRQEGYISGHSTPSEQGTETCGSAGGRRRPRDCRGRGSRVAERTAIESRAGRIGDAGQAQHANIHHRAQRAGLAHQARRRPLPRKPFLRQHPRVLVQQSPRHGARWAGCRPRSSFPTV